jgi:molybdenum cofactor cytidylyltransferase
MPRSQTLLPTPKTVAAVVLAAGSSRRMGDINKLMLSIEGTPMVLRVVEVLERSCVDRILVVTGHEAERIGEALSGRKVEVVHNPDYEEGIGTSIRTGISTLGKDLDGALIVLADMPWVGTEVVDRLIDAFTEADERSIFVPSFGGKRGNPTLWSSKHFPELLELAGDVGGKRLLHRCSEAISYVQVESTAIGIDVDTPDVLRELGIGS